MARRVIIMGAAGRDFHNFNMFFRDNPDFEVLAFTATQIPDIAGKKYPAVLAGKNYSDGIPIFDESELETIIEKKDIDLAIFSYSDISHEYVMHQASRVLATGADFTLMGGKATMLKSTKPVVSVTAVRTGCGKSPVSRKIAETLKAQGKTVAVIRHPMPYGDLEKQICQRFETIEDLKKHDCTIEEMEEYEPHILNGVLVFAGIDYEKILREAEKDADVIIWDGGNNDIPFIEPTLDIVVTDPHRPNHELNYFPGETNFRRGKILVITKIDSAEKANLEILEGNIKMHNPKAEVMKANLAIGVEDESKIKGKKVLVVEDGPTLTHGEMSFGAGILAAKRFGAAEIIDPTPYLVGKLKDTFKKYPSVKGLLPAMGYGEEQMRDLEATIRATPCDTVIIGTPIDLRRICKIDQESTRVSYDLEEIEGPTVEDLLKRLS